MLRRFWDIKIQIGLLIIITLICYLNIFGNGFAWDDRDFLINWPQIKGEQGYPAYLSLPALLKGDLPIDHRGVFRPLRSVYYLVSYSLWGQNPFGYHLQALITHLLIVIVVYLLTEQLTKKRAVAFIVAALFSAHPIHTEGVTYITASFDTLGILFFFLAFYFYIKREEEKSRRKIFLIASIIYGLFAYLIYEMTLVLPLIIILHDFYKNGFSFKKLFSKAQVYRHYFFMVVLYLLVRFVVLGIGNRADYLGVVWQIASNQARVGMVEIFAKYMGWLIWPVHLSIAHEMPTEILLSILGLFEKIDQSGNLINLFGRVVIVFPIFYALIGLTFCYLFLKKQPVIFFGCCFIIVTLLPVSSILPQGATLAERFLYIPSFGFVLVLGMLIYNGFTALRKINKLRYLSYVMILFFLILVSFYSYLTIKRNVDWKDEKSIWVATIKSGPTNPMPYGALASVYLRESQPDRAIELFQQALDLNQPSAKLNSDLGLAYEKKGEVEKAISQQQKALEIEPRYYLANVDLGNIYLKQQQFELAEKEFDKALKLNKDDAEILSYSGDLYYQQQKYDLALRRYQQAFNIYPGSAKYTLKLGMTYLKQSKFDLAIQAFKLSLSFNPKQVEVYSNLASIYEQKGDIFQAKETIKQGLIINDDQVLKDRLRQLIEEGNKS